MVSSSVVVPRLCGHGPQEAKWVGAMGKPPSHQQPIWRCIWRVSQARSPEQGWWVRVPGLEGPGQPGEHARQRRPTCALPWLSDNRCEWLSLLSLAKQLVPWTDKWQCPRVPSLKP
jgi:hypothetical protein